MVIFTATMETYTADLRGNQSWPEFKVSCPAIIRIQRTPGFLRQMGHEKQILYLDLLLWATTPEVPQDPSFLFSLLLEILGWESLRITDKRNLLASFVIPTMEHITVACKQGENWHESEPCNLLKDTSCLRQSFYGYSLPRRRIILCIRLILALLWSLKMSVHFFLFSGSRIFHLVCLEIFNQQGAKDTTLCFMDQKTMCGQEV